MLLRALFAVLLFLACAGGQTARAQGAQASEGLSESLHTVRLARGTDLRLQVSRRDGTTPAIAVLLFPGYPGVLRIRLEDGVLRHELAGNFLVRARRFLNTEQTFTVLVDCPDDRHTHCEDAYRTSAEHAADIDTVVAAVRREFGAKQVYLAGTSYGTVSTSFLARALGTRIDGAVHSATFTDPRPTRNAHGQAMRTFDWSQAKAPQLFVHHRDDPCELTRYDSVVARRKDVPLITVEGAANVRGEPCLAFTQHGFVGRERATMRAIVDWITTRQAPAVVGGP